MKKLLSLQNKRELRLRMIKYEEKTLNSGLRVIVNEDRNTELVAVNMLYKVGAKNEDENHTGFAHLFEHLMFSGSENFSDFDMLINSLGGESNAFTNNDITNFYVTVPYIYLETILRIEADRMNNLLIDDWHLNVQKKVVCEEFKQRYLNQPYGDLYKEMRELSFKVHPYKWQTIGKDISHIESADLDTVKRFYDEYYLPNNAVLSISGKVKCEEVFELAEEIFCFPAGKEKQIRYSQEPIQKENRQKTVFRDVPSDIIMITFPMCERKNKDFYTYDILSDLLSNGTSSRMYISLVQEKKAFTGIDAVLSGDDDKGLFIIVGKYSEGTSVEEGERLIWQTLEEICSGKISDREFEKVKNKYIVSAEFNNIQILDKAMNLGYYAHLDMLENINNDKIHYSGITKQEVVALAKQVFMENKHNTLYYLKERK